MWEISNSNQIISFLFSMCLGAIFCIIYDVIRAVRKVCLSSFFAITVTDILLWVFYAFVTFIFLIARTDGEIRGYVLIGELLGFVIIRVSISVWVYKAMVFVFVQISLIKQTVIKCVKTIYCKIEKLFLRISLSCINSTNLCKNKEFFTVAYTPKILSK